MDNVTCTLNLHRFASSGCDLVLEFQDELIRSTHLRRGDGCCRFFVSIHDLESLRPVYDALSQHFSPSASDKPTPPADEGLSPRASSSAGGPPPWFERNLRDAIAMDDAYRRSKLGKVVDRLRNRPRVDGEFEAEAEEFSWGLGLDLPTAPPAPKGELVIPLDQITEDTLRVIAGLLAAQERRKEDRCQAEDGSPSG